jgi:hypothetical protein
MLKIKILSSFLFLKMEFTRNQDTFKNSHLFKNNKQKNMLCTGTTISIYHNKLQKNCSKIHSYEKGFFGKMTCNFFLK